MPFLAKKIEFRPFPQPASNAVSIREKPSSSEYSIRTCEGASLVLLGMTLFFEYSSSHVILSVA